MATMEEYIAVHGRKPPAGKTPATELGDGGCNAVYRTSGMEVIGRWSSWDDASHALNALQEIGLRWEYHLEASHHWVSGLSGTPTCSLCGEVRRPHPHPTAGIRQGIEWPS